MASLRAGMAGAEPDTAGAFALATASGAEPRIVAPLIAAFSAGIASGRAKKAEGQDEPNE
jgi:hypothetical protein